MSMLWKGFQKPKRLEVERDTLTSTYGKFWAQPFERGFGHTIGNALRRALLSSIEGAAVTAVKIEGVLHEFSSLPGVVEDTTNIILNLKQVHFRLSGSGPKTIELRKSTAGDVLAKDLAVDADVEIMNPDQHVCTLAEGGSINMEMRIKNGRGYVPADRNFDSILPVGYIPVDSVHSPVRRVNYHVEDARLGQTTDYDKLIIEVWTNGACLPQTAVAMSAKLIRDHLNIFINFEETDEEEDSPADEVEGLNENLNRSVEELELSVRSYNCLKEANISNIAELVQKTEEEIGAIRNLSPKAVSEVKEILASMGLSLGMKLDKRASATE